MSKYSLVTPYSLKVHSLAAVQCSLFERPPSAAKKTVWPKHEYKCIYRVHVLSNSAFRHVVLFVTFINCTKVKPNKTYNIIDSIFIHGLKINTFPFPGQDWNRQLKISVFFCCEIQVATYSTAIQSATNRLFTSSTSEVPRSYLVSNNHHFYSEK